jgi:hypothetical protein
MDDRNAPILVGSFGEINVLTSLKLGSQFVEKYSNLFEWVAPTLRYATDRLTSSPTYIVIREPHKRLLTGIHTVLLNKRSNLSPDKSYLVLRLKDFDQKDIEIKLPNNNQWASEHGYKMYLFLLNRFWHNFKIDPHISPWLNTVEEIIDAHPNFKLIDIESLTNLIKRQGIKVNENSKGAYRHSNSRFYESIEKALTSPDLKPYIKSFFDNILAMEKQSYERLKDKVVKIDKPLFTLES